jgi:hypothetical protein
MEMPTGVCTFYMDTTDPRTPAVAVSCGSFIYVFKNLRPYFKFTLPLLEVGTWHAKYDFLTLTSLPPSLPPPPSLSSSIQQRLIYGTKLKR